MAACMTMYRDYASDTTDFQYLHPSTTTADTPTLSVPSIESFSRANKDLSTPTIGATTMLVPNIVTTASSHSSLKASSKEEPVTSSLHDTTAASVSQIEDQVGSIPTATTISDSQYPSSPSSSAADDPHAHADPPAEVIDWIPQNHSDVDAQSQSTVPSIFISKAESPRLPRVKINPSLLDPRGTWAPTDKLVQSFLRGRGKKDAHRYASLIENFKANNPTARYLRPFIQKESINPTCADTDVEFKYWVGSLCNFTLQHRRQSFGASIERDTALKLKWSDHSLHEETRVVGVSGEYSNMMRKDRP